MKNKLLDLNNHLFEQLERLNDDELTDEQLTKEIQRAKAMSTIATNIINNANVALEVQKYYGEYGSRVEIPEMLGIENKEKK